jgi:hypothetical protein
MNYTILDCMFVSVIHDMDHLRLKKSLKLKFDISCDVSHHEDEIKKEEINVPEIKVEVNKRNYKKRNY